ncbi:MAG: hypothetical protein QM817_18140 [Archangium sp.]
MEPGIKGNRVDKKWVENGIEAYSTEAILGTLAHYGVAIDEAKFLEQAKLHFPLAMAEEWHSHWKGTGQFSRFPAAAAEELWARLKKGEIAPTDLGLALINLMKSMEVVLDGKPDDGTHDTRFKVVEAYLPKLPPAGEDGRRNRFLGETLASLGEWSAVLDTMAEALAEKGALELANRLASIDEGMFPEHAGITRGLIKTRTDREAGVADLKAIGHDAARLPLTRLAAAEALVAHEQAGDAKPILLALLDHAEKERDAELAGNVVETLRKLLESDSGRGDLLELRDRIEKLVRTFEAAS